MKESEKSRLSKAYEKLKYVGVAVGVGLIAIGTMFGLPGVATSATSGMLLDLAVVDPNIKQTGRAYDKWKKKRGK